MRQGRNRYRVDIDPITTKAGFVLSCDEVGFIIHEEKYRQDDYGFNHSVHIEYNNEKKLVGSFLKGEKRDWHEMFVAALKYFDIKHPYNQ